jgi:hypothetical protein
MTDPSTRVSVVGMAWYKAENFDRIARRASLCGLSAAGLLHVLRLDKPAGEELDEVIGLRWRAVLPAIGRAEIDTYRFGDCLWGVPWVVEDEPNVHARTLRLREAKVKHSVRVHAK